MGIAELEERGSLAHAYVERLEAALATAAHERDLAREKARLAGEGVGSLEQRLRELRGGRDRERAEAALELERHLVEAERKHERELAEAEGKLREAERELRRELGEARATLEARQKHLENAQRGIESRDRKLKAAGEALTARDERLRARDEELASRDEELKAVGASLEAQRTELAVARARLELREEELERSRATAGEAQGALDSMRERLSAREQEVDAASRLLEAQDAELAQARRALAKEREDLDEALRAAEGAAAERDGAVRARDEALRDQVEARRARDEARGRLEAREGHLRNAQVGIESRDRKLAVAERTVESRDAELASQRAELESRAAEIERLRAAARARERSLALAEARLDKAQQRAEHFRGSLVELREGKAYRLMRILWRLRRPFRRTSRRSAEPTPAEDEADGASQPPEQREARVATPAPSSRPAREPGGRLRVASILDEMSEACFAPECELTPLALEGWAEQLDERCPDLLLVESAWNGNGGEWQYRIARYPRKDLVGLPALRALIDGCRERGIPTAFWNKEDPVHFERFAEAAALFDHVFTTDARCVERYRALPGEERTVTPLPFAAQPRIHNPAAVVPERGNSPCFAGAWYRDRHPDRRRALAALLDAARPRGLVIYDRSFGGDDGAFGFPERFAPHILGKLPYERILDVYKSHRVFLNANSVVDSPTMCSRRVFELAACDTAILSTPGAALRALLGEGTIEEAADEETAAAALERLLGDEADRRRRTRAARRKVFAEHTYAARLATIAKTADLDAPHASGNGWELVAQPGVALSDDARTDLLSAAVFAEADAIGVHASPNGAGPLEHRRVDALDPRALLLSRELIETRGQPTGSPEQIHAQLRQWSDEGVRLYAADADLLTPSVAQQIAQPA